MSDATELHTADLLGGISRGTLYKVCSSSPKETLSGAP